MATRKKTVKKKTTADAKSTAKAEEKFKSDLLVRGEAVSPGADGKLPLDATHEIVEQGTDAATTKVVRRRFKLY
jgi:autotransporter adhesin